MKTIKPGRVFFFEFHSRKTYVHKENWHAAIITLCDNKCVCMYCPCLISLLTFQIPAPHIDGTQTLLMHFRKCCDDLHLLITSRPYTTPVEMQHHFESTITVQWIYMHRHKWILSLSIIYGLLVCYLIQIIGHQIWIKRIPHISSILHFIRQSKCFEKYFSDIYFLLTHHNFPF